jgi:hypothetical protein
MTTVGRNEPCPCGSGKKYKKCCLERMEAAAVAERQRQYAEIHARRERPPTMAEVKAALAASIQRTMGPGITWDPDDELDDVTNSVPGMIREKRFDEALAACDRLLREWPEVAEGLERSAQVHEAMGSNAIAIDFYRRAIEFTERPEQRDGYDEEIRQEWRDKIAELTAKL